MKKWIITWNAGWGERNDVVEADSWADAKALSYERALQEFEDNASYVAEEWTEAAAAGLELS